MSSHSDSLGRAAVLLSLLLVAPGCASGRAIGPEVAGDTTVVDSGASFRGWKAIVMRRGQRRVTIVPALGRVMGFDFAEDQASPEALDPFWSHPHLGPELAPDPEGWINYGGDKAWPAPQSDWLRVAGRAWPPPATFDAQPFTTLIHASNVEILSAVDPAFGIRVRRKMDLWKDDLFITTTYEKVEGGPVRVAVWTITQLKPPERMFVLLPSPSGFEGGLRSRMSAPPRDARVDGRLASLARDPNEKTMVASDGDALLWIGEGRSMLVEKLGQELRHKRGETRSWPDDAHAQIYTSPDGDQRYVELELLGPLIELRPGQTTSMQVRYRLSRRSEADPLREAQKIFEPKLRD